MRDCQRESAFEVTLLNTAAHLWQPACKDAWKTQFPTPLPKSTLHDGQLGCNVVAS